MVHIQIDNTGTPRTINKSIKVAMIVQKHIMADESIDAIATHYDIAISDVYASLAYYHDNKSQMDAEFAQTEAIVKQIGVDGHTLREKIQQRMTNSHSDDS